MRSSTEDSFGPTVKTSTKPASWNILTSLDGGSPDNIDVQAGRAFGHLSAIDVATGEIRWRYRDIHPMMGGVLSTEGGVVFTGNQSGDALAMDARTGEVVWTFRLGAGVRSQPIAPSLALLARPKQYRQWPQRSTRPVKQWHGPIRWN